MSGAHNAPVDRGGLTQDNYFTVEPIYNICTLIVSSRRWRCLGGLVVGLRPTVDHASNVLEKLGAWTYVLILYMQIRPVQSQALWWTDPPTLTISKDLLPELILKIKSLAATGLCPAESASHYVGLEVLIALVMKPLNSKYNDLQPV
jgi:hypothetical protein